MTTLRSVVAVPFRLAWTLWLCGSGFAWDQADAKLRDPSHGLARRLAREERYPADR